jgi:hypothetical protein
MLGVQALPRGQWQQTPRPKLGRLVSEKWTS